MGGAESKQRAGEVTETAESRTRAMSQPLISDAGGEGAAKPASPPQDSKGEPTGFAGDHVEHAPAPPSKEGTAPFTLVQPRDDKHKPPEVTRSVSVGALGVRAVAAHAHTARWRRSPLRCSTFRTDACEP